MCGIVGSAALAAEVRTSGAEAPAFILPQRRAEALLHPVLTGVSAIYEMASQCRLKYWTARSWALAFASDENVPRLRRLPVLGFFFREYRRNSPDFSLRIMVLRFRMRRNLVEAASCV